MVIRSAGSCTWGLRLDLVNASAKDKLPIRPQYISSIMTILENVFRLLVTPVLMPEVPMAEHVSKNTSDMGRLDRHDQDGSHDGQTEVDGQNTGGLANGLVLKPAAKYLHTVGLADIGVYI